MKKYQREGGARRDESGRSEAKIYIKLNKRIFLKALLNTMNRNIR